MTQSKINKLKRIVSNFFNLRTGELESRIRETSFCEARCMFCGICYNVLKIRNKNQIGRYLGRDHSTIINALQNHNDFMLCDKIYERKYNQLLQIVNAVAFKCADVDIRSLFKTIDISSNVMFRAKNLSNAIMQTTEK